jgi:hypothetical protein
LLIYLLVLLNKFNANLVPKIFEKLKHESSDVQLEALYVLVNITKKGNAAQLGYLVTLGCVGAVAPFLEDNRDVRRLVVDVISKLLPWAEGEHRFEELKEEYREDGNLDRLGRLVHENYDYVNVKNLAKQILETHFPVDNDDK